MLQIRSLQVHHLSQQLILQTVTSHREVYQRGLSLNLRFIVRIRQLSVQNQMKIWMKITLLVSNFNTPAEPDTTNHIRNQVIGVVIWCVVLCLSRTCPS